MTYSNVDFVFVIIHAASIQYEASAGRRVEVRGADPAATPEDRLRVLKDLAASFPLADFHFRKERPGEEWSVERRKLISMAFLQEKE